MTNKSKFEVFDKVFFTNPRDDILPMIYDMNNELIEKEWIIPRMKLFIDFCDKYINEYNDYIRLQFFLYPKILIHKNDYRKNKISFLVSVKPSGYSHQYFLILLDKLFGNEIHKYINDNKIEECNKTINAYNAFVDSLLGKNANGSSIVTLNHEKLSNTQINLISNSLLIEGLILKLKWMKLKLKFLEEKNNLKEKSIIELLL